MNLIRVCSNLPLFGIGLVIFAFVSSAYPCEVRWREPRNHFDGVNEYGFVSYWDQIGELDFGDGIKIPLVIGFRSDRERSSPYLGYGWTFGLLDSHIVQQSENAFDLIQPDGIILPFGRDGKNPSLLNGAKGWKGQIKADSITLWASCGWKLSYIKGKIASITTPKNQTLLIHRDDKGVATELVVGAQTLMRVERSAKGEVTALEMGIGRIGLEQAEKPRVQSINSVNLIGATDASLGKIVFPNGKTKSFEYALDGKLKPTMTVSSDGQSRQIVWDPATKFILKDGQWTYDIKPSEIKGVNASIERFNPKRQSEFWHYDSTKGTETVMLLDGTKRVKSWFMSGVLASKLRSIETSKGGHVLESVKRTYDETGRLIREISADSVRKFQYDDGGRLSKITNADGSFIKFRLEENLEKIDFFGIDGTLRASKDR